jgi:penicillin-binding protein 1A
MPPGRGPRPSARRAQEDDQYGAKRRKRRRVERKRNRRRAVVLGSVAIAGLLVVVAGSAVTGVATLGASCDLNSLRRVEIGQNSFIYAADGSLLGGISSERNRQPVPLKRISPWLPKATVAIEDRRFYEHGGIDPSGIARAVWSNLRAGKVVEGGSTITQQLVRNLYISREQTFQRKLKEACLAIKLNRAWSRDKILATYMNQVYYGNLAYGIEAAAQTYFSKHAHQLTLPEAALLAGLPQAPSAYDPFNQTEIATGRRNQVLRAMLNEGTIDREQYDWAVRRGLGLKAGKLYTTIREPYFFSYVRDELVAEYGSATVRSGGLKVYTTIDPRFQRAAQKAIRETLYERTDPAAALISIDPRSGAIRAMTAVTPGLKKNQFNLLSQAERQSGSTFKTFVLAAAVEKGINPATTSYLSAPFFYRPDPAGNCEDGSWWCPETYDQTYTGWTSIEQATVRSDNTVYAQLTLDVTPEAVAAMARKLGVRSRLTTPDGAYVPSIGLGSIEVTPLDMASAYATLAAGGIYSEPRAIKRVVLASGKEDESAGWGKPKRKRVLSEGVAYTVTKILEKNMQYGTGTGANYGHPAAGKTGTTEEHSDAWFCGYTPRLETTVWIGYPRGKIPMTNVHGIRVSGGSFPAQIWRLFMSSAIGQLEPLSFPEPSEYPEWSSFERGQYARSFGYSGGYDSGGSDYVPPATTEGGEETTPAPTPATTQAPAPAPTTTAAPPPPVTTAPSPPPTEPPPPPVTTEPPPPTEPIQP